MQREGIRTARIILMHPVGLFAVNDIHHTSDTCSGKRIQTTLSADYHTSTTNLNEDDGFRAFQDHLPRGELKKLLKITNIPLAPLLARGFCLIFFSAS
jgi:hypothetical protein